MNVQVARTPGKPAGTPPWNPFLEHGMRKDLLLAVGLLTALMACNKAPLTLPESGETTTGAALSADHTGRNTVVVNPDAPGNGVAATIQEGIDMVAPGGRVLIRPGLYPEVVFVEKGVTLEPLGDVPGLVIVEPPASSIEGIEIQTADPVLIRGLTVRHAGGRGIFGFDNIDLTVEGVAIEGANLGIGVLNDAPTPLPPARLIVRDSHVQANNFGIFAGGSFYSEVERNVVRSPGVLCIEFRTRRDGGGQVDGAIRGNDLDRCGGNGAIRVGRDFTMGAPNNPMTATGSVDVIGNHLRNSTASCTPRVGILFEVLGGRIEHNDVLSYIQSCAVVAPRVIPAAIFVGSRFPMPGATPTVRFNDLSGNAQAGLRIAPTVLVPLDASCNWWGAATGPSGAGAGAGDALQVEAGAASPTYLPFATASFAGTGATGC